MARQGITDLSQKSPRDDLQIFEITQQYNKYNRAYAAVSAEVVEPWPDRPTEGFFHFNVEFSPMANPSWESGLVSAKTLTSEIQITFIIGDNNG